MALALAGAAVAPGAAGGAAAAAVADFPARDSGYHTYPEMAADIHDVADAHPAIVRVFSIGHSYQGRELWAAEVSDNVGVDEGEPEVFLDGLHHGLEHMSAEIPIAVLHWLAKGYATNARIRAIVDSRRIWIVFMVNPDGGQYDIHGGAYHDWRKNRQPTPGTSAVGSDINRNYGYHWGCCGGSSPDPWASRFRGPHAWSTPEARAVRDFVLGRRVDGRQRIRTAISFHTSGRLILYPYGYTRANVPADMTHLDHRTFVALAARMAASNGYTPEQSSDLYLDSGNRNDWLYGRQGVFAFTFELTLGDHPPDERIGPETRRNRDAILTLMELSDCPYRVLGAGATAAHCPPGA